MPSDCRRMGEAPKVQLEGSDPRRRYQVTLMGGARVGKSTIVSQFLYDKVSHCCVCVLLREPVRE